MDVGLEITAKFTNSNGEVIHCSTYRGLNEDDNFNQAHILLRKEFDNRIRERIGPDISPDNFPDVNLEDMPLYEMYEDNATDVEGGLEGKTEDDEYPDMATGLEH